MYIVTEWCQNIILVISPTSKYCRPDVTTSQNKDLTCVLCLITLSVNNNSQENSLNFIVSTPTQLTTDNYPQTTPTQLTTYNSNPTKLTTTLI